MERKCLILQTFILFSCIAFAQNPEPFSFNSDITPSAETFQIRKYGNTTQLLYTGAMAFTLPLYTYNDEDFTIPITLHYIFDGYRPVSHRGTVGYGWALDCGGAITREVRGYPDEVAIGEGNFYGYYWATQDNVLNNEDYIIKSGKMRVDYFWYGTFDEAMQMDIYSDIPLYYDKYLTLDNKYETSPDIFYFNFIGLTGSFMLKEDGSMEIIDSSVPEGELNIEYDFIKYSINDDTDKKKQLCDP